MVVSITLGWNLIKLQKFFHLINFLAFGFGFKKEKEKRSMLQQYHSHSQSSRGHECSFMLIPIVPTVFPLSESSSSKKKAPITYRILNHWVRNVWHRKPCFPKYKTTVSSCFNIIDIKYFRYKTFNNYFRVSFKFETTGHGFARVWN